MLPITPFHKNVLAAIGLPGLVLASVPFLPQQRVAIPPTKAQVVSGPMPSGAQTAVAVATSGRVPAGTILAYAGENPPAGYLLCNGAEVLRGTYPELFDAIGTAWGFDTAFTFTIPDLRGRFLRGVDGVAANDPDSNSRVAINPGGNVGNNVGSLQGDGRRGFSGVFGGNTSSNGLHHHTIQTYNDDWDEDDGDSRFHLPGWADDRPFSVPSVDNGTNATGNHTHSVSVNVSFTGEAETRPKNAYVNFIIKF